jgi:hypothetical protein
LAVEFEGLYFEFGWELALEGVQGLAGLLWGQRAGEVEAGCDYGGFVLGRGFEHCHEDRDEALEAVAGCDHVVGALQQADVERGLPCGSVHHREYNVSLVGRQRGLCLHQADQLKSVLVEVGRGGGCGQLCPHCGEGVGLLISGGKEVYLFCNH